LLPKVGGVSFAAELQVDPPTLSRDIDTRQMDQDTIAALSNPGRTVDKLISSWVNAFREPPKPGIEFFHAKNSKAMKSALRFRSAGEDDSYKVLLPNSRLITFSMKKDSFHIWRSPRKKTGDKN
jgi:hypothetical protein